MKKWTRIIIFVLAIGFTIIGVFIIVQNQSAIIRSISSIVKTHYQKEIFTSHDSKKIVWGIDISHHQRYIDWDSLIADKPYFIFFKATEGSTHKDIKYKDYVKKARQNSIIVGAYHFFSYQSPGEKQAKHFVKTANLRKGDLPPVLDAEFRRNMPSREKVTAELLSFIETVTLLTGVKPIIYCECDYYNKYLRGHLIEEHHLWISDFWREPRCKWLFWQKTDKFKISGIKGTVDYNIFNGSHDQFIGVLIN